MHHLQTTPMFNMALSKVLIIKQLARQKNNGFRIADRKKLLL